MTLALSPIQARQEETVIYPESDGKPMSDHTLQFEWIVVIKDNLEALLAQNPDVFVAGDLLWYPVEGSPTVRAAPDALVAFGRPKGQRGSYQQWNEGNIAPQVVFGIWSPGNRFSEKLNQFLYYQRHGVEEYYAYDPFRLEFDAWLRSADGTELVPAENVNGLISPRLGIRFDFTTEQPLRIFLPNGEPFQSFMELKEATSREHEARLEAEARAERLAERLRELGVNPNTL